MNRLLFPLFGAALLGLTSLNAQTATADAARLVNIATRAQIGGAAGTPIAGFVIGGTGSKTMLVRGVGPGLTAFGLSGTLADPRLSLVSGNATVASNDNWLSADAPAMSAAGAFGLSAGSKDAAAARP